uniref:HECT domain-containing protein n=1 Tax=Mesocestoides corti TaxID=53468 RepID=A0A0R3UCC9_MESCO
LGLHRLAAKAQIFELVDKHSALSEDDGGRAELRQQIVEISTNTNVISPFTSFIGVDPDKQVLRIPYRRLLAVLVFQLRRLFQVGNSVCSPYDVLRKCQW